MALRMARPARTLTRHLRPFHSYDHPPPSTPFTTAEETILSSAYKHVPEHGFSSRALGLGAKDAGYLDISPSVLPDGAFSLIRYHLVKQRLGLAERNRELFKDQQTSKDQRTPGVGRRVAALTWERLLANKDIIHQWQEVSSTTPSTPSITHQHPGPRHHGPTNPRPRIHLRTRPPLR